MGKGKDFRPSRRRGGFDDDVMPSFEMPRERPARSFGGPSPFESAPPSGPAVDATVSCFNPEKGFGFTSLSDGSGDAFLHIGQLQAIGRESVPPGATLKVQVAQGAKGKQVVKVLEVDESTAQPQQFRPRPAGPRPGGFGAGGGYGAGGSGGGGYGSGGGYGGGGGGYGAGGGGGGFGGAPRPPRRMVDPSTATPLDGVVKWFNPDKGFGFIVPDQGGKDVFVHIRAVERAGLSTLHENQRVRFIEKAGQKGTEADGLEVI
jgi:CspA family cold shock protein